jgi:striatin 1/3/4
MIITGGHDGAVRGWDLNNYSCLFDVAAHRRKYDEGIFSVGFSQNYPFIASGGSDSIIKLVDII